MRSNITQRVMEMRHRVVHDHNGPEAVEAILADPELLAVCRDVIVRHRHLRGTLADASNGNIVPVILRVAIVIAAEEIGSRQPADFLLDRIEAWTPIKLREELLGDIKEDVQHRREQGWTEKRLRRLIWWQFSYAVAGWLWGRAEAVLDMVVALSK